MNHRSLILLKYYNLKIEGRAPFQTGAKKHKIIQYIIQVACYSRRILLPKVRAPPGGGANFPKVVGDAPLGWSGGAKPRGDGAPPEIPRGATPHPPSPCARHWGRSSWKGDQSQFTTYLYTYT